MAPTISSRTPEGSPNECSICGLVSVAEPSLPFGDACCSHCGSLLGWFRDNLRSNLGIASNSITLDITFSTSFSQEIGADSLDIVELMMELEEEFDITIPDDEAEKMRTVGDVIRLIVRQRRTQE